MESNETMQHMELTKPTQPTQPTQCTQPTQPTQPTDEAKKTTSQQLHNIIPTLQQNTTLEQIRHDPHDSQHTYMDLEHNQRPTY